MLHTGARLWRRLRSAYQAPGGVGVAADRHWPLPRAVVERGINVGSASVALRAGGRSGGTRRDPAKHVATLWARRSIDEDRGYPNRQRARRYGDQLRCAPVGSQERVKKHRNRDVEREGSLGCSRMDGLSNRDDSVEKRLSTRAVRRLVQVDAAMRAGTLAWILGLSVHRATRHSSKLTPTSRALRSPQVFHGWKQQQQHCKCNDDFKIGGAFLENCRPQRRTKAHTERRPENHPVGEPSSAFDVLPDRHEGTSYRFHRTEFYHRRMRSAAV